MPQPLFSGVGVALVTLFQDDGGLDAAATAGHAARLVELGIRAVVVAGTTGEASPLSPGARRERPRAVREALPPGSPVAVLASLLAQGRRHSSGHTDQLRETADIWDGPLYVGSSSLLALAGPLGCTGAILALANAEPEGCSAAFAGDADAQRAL